jgi:hypothetical protein
MSNTKKKKRSKRSRSKEGKRVKEGYTKGDGINISNEVSGGSYNTWFQSINQQVKRLLYISKEKEGG